MIICRSYLPMQSHLMDTYKYFHIRIVSMVLLLSGYVKLTNPIFTLELGGRFLML